MISESMYLKIVLICVVALPIYGLIELIYRLCFNNYILKVIRRIGIVVLSVFFIFTLTYYIIIYTKAFPSYSSSKEIKISDTDKLSQIEEQCFKVAKEFNTGFELNEFSMYINNNDTKKTSNDTKLIFKYTCLNKYEIGDCLLGCDISVNYNKKAITNVHYYYYDVPRDCHYSEMMRIGEFEDFINVSDFIFYFSDQIKTKYYHFKNPAVCVGKIFSDRFSAQLSDNDIVIAEYDVLLKSNKIEFIEK